mmetsp:Transcript_25424/g.31161  ORF Transcript_25424/g.31161 Transcript_25424/m.31161 type:complete len:92 (-) Transcript_25424:2152-2427(-)
MKDFVVILKVNNTEVGNKFVVCWKFLRKILPRLQGRLEDDRDHLEGIIRETEVEEDLDQDQETDLEGGQDLETEVEIKTSRDDVRGTEIGI